MRKEVKIIVATISLIIIFLNLFEVYENKILTAICYLVITILLFIKTKGN